MNQPPWPQAALYTVAGAPGICVERAAKVSVEGSRAGLRVGRGGWQAGAAEMAAVSPGPGGAAPAKETLQVLHSSNL